MHAPFSVRLAHVPQPFNTNLEQFLHKLNAILRAGSLIVALFPLHAFATSFDDAEGTAKKFIDEYEGIRKLTVDEQKELVAIGRGFDEDAEASLLRDSAERVWAHVNDRFHKLEQLKSTFEKQSAIALADKALSDKAGAINDYRKRINDELWPRIERMMQGINAGNNPVFKYFTRLGYEAHGYYQGLSGECHAKEFAIGSGRADCVKRSPPKCEVIEIKANNSKAVYRGRSEAKEYAKELNKFGGDFTKLVSVDSGFKDCKEFIPRVACYAASLNFDNDGNTFIQSLGWAWCDP